jgi:hypothetical protein
MSINIEASSLSLNDVHRLLNLQEQFNGSFLEYFYLESLTDFEIEDLSFYMTQKPKRSHCF